MELVYDAGRVVGFEGKALLKMPKYRDRLQMIKSCQFKIDASGDVVNGMDNLDSLSKMVEFASKAVEKLMIKHIDSGVVAKSFEELEYNPIFDAILNDISGYYLNAGKLGNEQKPS